MLRRLTALGSGALFIGLAVVAWRLRSSTTEGYRAMWRRFSDDKWADSQLTEFHAASGVYGVVFVSAVIGVALIVSAAAP